jgi:hypothetical protein
MARLIVEYGLLEAERVCQKERTKGFLIDVDIFVARTQARDTIKFPPPADGMLNAPKAGSANTYLTTALLRGPSVGARDSNNQRTVMNEKRSQDLGQLSRHTVE